MRLGVGAALVDGTWVPGDVEVADGLIAAVGCAGGGTGVAVPGFVDLQVNGFAGADFFEAGSQDYRRAGAALLAAGVTSYLPAFVSAPEPHVRAALARMPAQGAPRVLGAHLEGPFLHPGRLGAHDVSYRQEPDAGALDRLLDAGPVRLVTLAPELEGALPLVAALRRRGIAVSAGHSDATAEQAHTAFDAGVGAVTHVFNAMRALTAREPGLAGAALARDDVVVMAIADGVHLVDDVLRLVRSCAAGRVALVSDATAAAAAPDGEHFLGGATVRAVDGAARRLDGSLAGSTLSLDEAVRRYCAVGAPLAEAAAAASSVPARLIGADAGRLAPGLRADLVVLDDALEVRKVLCAGVLAHG